MQAMLPPPAAETIEHLDMKRAIAVLVAMDPDAAASVMAEMGSERAATKLMVSWHLLLLLLLSQWAEAA